jgi:hypothetical protein
VRNGHLLGDGSIVSKGHITAEDYVTARGYVAPQQKTTVIANGAHTLDCDAYSSFYLRNDDMGDFTVTLNVDNARAGQEIQVFVASGNGGILNITWDSAEPNTVHRFSGPDAAMAPGDSSVLWRAIVIVDTFMFGNKILVWTATRN